MINFKHSIIILPLFLIGIGFLLLTGGRFDRSWAGGTGSAAHQQATGSEGETYRRGEIVTALEDQKITFGEAIIWMEAGSQVELTSGIPAQEHIKIIQGRVVVLGPLTLSVREVRLENNGLVSFTYYSWLDEADIVILEGNARLVRNDRAETLVGRALRTTTLPPYADEEISFDPLASSASDFYETVFLDLGFSTTP